MSSFDEVKHSICQILKDDRKSHSGTGFFILPGGYILTCYHVIQDLNKFFVKITNDQTLHQAEYLKKFSNPTADFAVLKLSNVSIDAVQLGRVKDGHEVFGFGFRPKNISIEPEGHSFYGYLRSGQTLQFGERKNEVLNFYVSEDISKGVSGGPIYDIHLRRVVGFFKAKETNNPLSQIAYVIPMDEIFAHWPDLEKENTKQVPDKKEDSLIRGLRDFSLQHSESISSSHRIFGRRTELTLLNRFVNKEKKGYFFITGPAGFGKTTLLRNWAICLKSKDFHVVIHLIRQTSNPDLYSCLKILCKQLMEINGLVEKIPHDMSELQILFAELLKWSPPASTRIVIILDGLDEAIDWPDLSSIIPSSLPEGIFFVASMRDEINEVESLKKRLKCTNHIKLPKLYHADIVDWLRFSENNALKSLSMDKTFTEELARKTDGFPLYLHYLIDEINDSLIHDINNSPREKAYRVLEKSPPDFSLYVHDQFSLLVKTGNVENNRRFQELFALLSIAHSALSEDDVMAMIEITEWDLRSLPWSLRRWFNIITTETSRLYSFTHPLLAQEFKRELRNESQDALKKILDYCFNFQRHKSPYAFRHFTEHLLETQQYEKLFALVDNKIFWNTLFETFPEDLLQTISKNFNAALRAAIETNNIERTAHYLIFHAKLLAAIRDMSPSGALSKGNLQLA
ncbi:NACHT domain-containing protein [Methanosarcina sp. Z-7115]|uniref:NACHT domain-containing protein n=1 Tax=Methanosarcina baikalica TaxID=3073890 RepID=A0ABU2D0Z6_9EURY|nr:trypsin-like peptidase domain-containing protein [Methanosarcina sp. Z-7115]MDR7665656.1 NACHT domain-containing protein [Methanosarcina sp. Z-7115]